MLLSTPQSRQDTASIIPVMMTPETRCLESYRLTRPGATIPNDSVKLAPDTIESFSEFLDTKAEWQRPLLKHLECASTGKRLYEFLWSGESIKFTLASDGGAREDLESYGCEIAIGCELLR